MNETKINDLNANFLFNKLANYKFIHKQRNCNNGAGGVAIILKKNINFEQVNLFDELNLELLAINIKINREMLTIIAYYNPPTLKVSEQLFETIKTHKLNYLMCGDLNAKSKSFGCRANNVNGLAFESILCNNDCIIINNDVSTYHSFNATVNDDILDLAICSPSVLNKICKFEVLTSDEMTSDHCPIRIQLKKIINSKSNCQNSRKI